MDMSWCGEPLLAVFFVPVDPPIGLPPETAVNMIRSQESVPWLEFTGGLNFVGIRVYRIPGTIDPDITGVELATEVARLVTTLPADSAIETEYSSITFGNAPRPGPVAVRHCVVELATPLLLNTNGSANESMSDAFDRCIQELGRFMVAYSLVAGDLAFIPLTRQRCPPFLPFSTQSIDGIYGPTGLFFANDSFRYFPHDPPDLDSSQRDKLAELSARLTLNDPFTNAYTSIRTAQRELELFGNYTTSAISCFMSTEQLMNTLLLMLAWEESMDRHLTRNWFARRASVLTRMTRELQPRIGGNWSTPSESSFSETLRGLAKLRNDILHSGYNPTEREAKNALVANDTIEKFLKERVAD